MDCLHCGDCCNRMSPLTEEECPYIVKDGTFFFCSVYMKRPKECQSHEFHARFCPVGLSVLGLNDINKIRIRIDDGFEKTEKMKGEDGE